MIRVRDEDLLFMWMILMFVYIKHTQLGDEQQNVRGFEQTINKDNQREAPPLT